MVLFQSMISCQQNKKPQNADDKHLEVIDSIVFRTSNERFTYLVDRLYPTIAYFDDKAIADLMQSNIISVEGVGDTIFAFLNNDFLYYESNSNFPIVNDSLFEYFYPKYYDVIIDDDIPYFVYLKSDKDFVELVKNRKSGNFGWETAIVKDTVLSFFSGVKVGMCKDEVFLKLNMPEIKFNKKDFSLILCHASIPSEIWYKQIFKSKDYKLNTDKPNTQGLLKFSGGKLESIYLNPWIGYGDKVANSI